MDDERHLPRNEHFKRRAEAKPRQRDVGDAVVSTTPITRTFARRDRSGWPRSSTPSARAPNWNSTAIFIVWDDWGGWFDHVAAAATRFHGTRVSAYRCSSISPYAKHGYVSHVQHEFGSILRFTEQDFGPRPLSASDTRADDLSDCSTLLKSPLRSCPSQPPAPQAASRTHPNPHHPTTKRLRDGASSPHSNSRRVLFRPNRGAGRRSFLKEMRQPATTSRAK